MGKEKLPRYSEIPWDRIKEVRVSSDGSAYSFEFDLNGKSQKMTMTIAPGQTSFTLSSESGTPIVSAIQKGNEIRVLDFSDKLAFMKAAQPRKIPKAGKRK